MRTAGTPYLIMVLLPARNGAPHLRAQLESPAAQTRLPGQLILSDDRSRDDTLAIAADFARRAPFPVRMLRGPGRKVVANVMSLLASAPAGPLALADQDDVWLPCRLERGAAALAGMPADQPAIAAAARIVTCDHLAPPRVRNYPLFADFAPALVQNPAGGNTILMKGAAVALARAAARDADEMPPFHDWWLCQLVPGVGGVVVLAPPTVCAVPPTSRQCSGGRHRFARTDRAGPAPVRWHLWRMAPRQRAGPHGIAAPDDCA
jgi:glycosyltransferase involved in cell wall biosynthesis